MKDSLGKPTTCYDQILLTAVKMWLTGQPTTVRLRGDITEACIIANALKSCKDLQNELSSPTASLVSVMSKIKDKQKACYLFETKFGIKWPI